MDLGGQGHGHIRRLSVRPCSGLDARGFTMVVLLVVMAVMAVGMTAMLPTWRQQALRDKEDELVFRGNQYARALVLYSRKNGNQLPSNIDILYTGRYLRKKYKDPITGEDFGLLPAGQPPGVAGRGGPPPTGGQGTPTGQTPGGARGTGAPQSGMGGGSGSQVIGSIQGVYSKSTDTSIRIYQNQQRYIDWPFTIQTAQLQMGTAARGGGAGQPPRGGGPGGVQAPGRGGTPVPGGGRGIGQPPGRGGQPVPPRGGGGAPGGAPVSGRGRGTF